MQELKIVMRKIGVPNPATETISSADFEEYLAYQYLSNGYKVHTVDFKAVENGDREVTIALVKDVEEAKKK